MPIYEFECSEHGTFELARPMAQVREPATCPDCGGLGRRLLSAPNLASGSAIGRRAAAVDERSQNAPRIVHRQTAKQTDEPVKQALHTSRAGYPWAIGHG